jgi:TolB-like protein/tetratricopeptide (TPR) repeat protein
VLPFVDLSPGRDQGYLADGIAEEILNALAHVDGLRVPGRTSSFWFKGKDTRLADIGRELGVRSLLEGSVRRDGNRIRVTAQLVDAGNGFHLWSETFDRDLTDVFRVQEEISRAVAGALRVKLITGSGPARPARQPRIEAYEQFLLGRQLRAAGSPASMPAARDAFARAVALDPGYAAAHAGLAQAWGDLAGYLSSTPEEVTRAALLELASAERAIALDPDLPDGWVARAGHRLAYAWDWNGAMADVERARALDPSPRTASWQRAGALVALGRLPEAVEEAHRGTAADPLSAAAWTRLARVQLFVGDATGAEASSRRALEVSPDNGISLGTLGIALLGQGRLDESLALFANHPLPFFRLTGLAVTYHAMGRARESQAALDELVATLSLSAAYQVAEVHAFRGEADQAFEWLERARLQHDEGLEHVRGDELLRRIRSDPRWNAFLRRMNFPVD